jgi:arsenate reductase
MADRIFNVLFLSTGNSARSIMAEAILNKVGAGRFRAFSAGSHPKGAVHPLALKELVRLRLPTGGLSSKHWNVFAAPDAPEMDFICTFYDSAAATLVPGGRGGSQRTGVLRIRLQSKARTLKKRRHFPRPPVTSAIGLWWGSSASPYDR